MELTFFDRIYSQRNGVTSSDIEYLNGRLSFKLPLEFEHLYSQSNGFGTQVNDLCIEFWNIDQIVSFNEIYAEVICGHYIFFASSDEGYDSYAYRKEDGKIYVFPTDCGIEDISDGKFCANDLADLLEYWKKK